MIALDLHQWVHFLKIIEINELNDYLSGDQQTARALRSDINIEDTQKRIDFMYRKIISLRPLEMLQSNIKKVTNLKKWLKSLHSYA